MKTQLFTVILLSVILFSCSDSSTEAPETSADPITLEHKIEFQFDGGGFNNQVFRSDSLGYAGLTTILKVTISQTEYKAIFLDSNSPATFDDGASLTLTWPKSKDGITPWDNLWTNN